MTNSTYEKTMGMALCVVFSTSADERVLLLNLATEFPMYENIIFYKVNPAMTDSFKFVRL
jgi:hypothetical protein